MPEDEPEENWTVWSDGIVNSSIPMATNVTEEQAKGMVDEYPSFRYAMCDDGREYYA